MDVERQAGINTTVATKSLKISTFSASKAAKELLASFNSARLNSAIIDFMTGYGLDPSMMTLRRSTTLDKIATSGSRKSAKKGKFVSPDWAKVPEAYEWAGVSGIKAGNP